MDGDVNDQRTENRHDGREEAWVAVVAIGKKLTRAYIEEETGEEREDDSERLLWEFEEERCADSYERSECVSDEPHACGLRLPCSCEA